MTTLKEITYKDPICTLLNLMQKKLVELNVLLYTGSTKIQWEMVMLNSRFVPNLTDRR